MGGWACLDAGQAELAEDEEHHGQAHGVLDGPGPGLKPAQCPDDDQGSHGRAQDGHWGRHHPLCAGNDELGLPQTGRSILQGRREPNDNCLGRGYAEDGQLQFHRQSAGAMGTNRIGDPATSGDVNGMKLPVSGLERFLQFKVPLAQVPNTLLTLMMTVSLGCRLCIAAASCSSSLRTG